MFLLGIACILSYCCVRWIALHHLASGGDGTVWAWGRNSAGQLGDGSNTDRNSPVQVSNLSDIIAIAASSHSLALKSDGTVWAWGYNRYGQLGDASKHIAIHLYRCPILVT